ncbi:MAG TPA: 23S rRNA (guanosine(2251)-2'-O)-methyltransferase RlmB [Thermoanaerobaculia bacterium]|jgi:23S rRNA (guanosine2251-2'-O)-methyltransferase|nr:23S rRNA (guanosine(2251)-2'-O)-methyltransferase RlmB [Thermoanaerobaculia bacterium]
MYLYGFHPVREALRHRPHEVLRVLVSAARTGKRREEVEELCRRHRVAFEVVPEKALAERAGPAHNGMVAEVREAPAQEQRAGGDPDFLVLLEDVQDPRNLGAVLRVCEGAGVGQVLIRDRGSAPVSPTAAKTSAGASEWLPIERIPNTAAALERLKEEGYWVYGTDPDGDPPWEVDLKGKVVLCFGGEEKGLRARTRQICDRMIGLPMRGKVGSLNISTAAAALLYEAVRQRFGR